MALSIVPVGENKGSAAFSNNASPTANCASLASRVAFAPPDIACLRSFSGT